MAVGLNLGSVKGTRWSASVSINGDRPLQGGGFTTMIPHQNWHYWPRITLESANCRRCFWSCVYWPRLGEWLQSMVPHCARKVESFNASPNLLVLGAWGKVQFHWNSAFKVACLQMVVDLSCSCLQFSACGVISVNGSWTVPSSVVFFQRSRGAKSTFCCWPSIQVKGEANGRTRGTLLLEYVYLISCYLQTFTVFYLGRLGAMAIMPLFMR